jgi:hypothetical protein
MKITAFFAAFLVQSVAGIAVQRASLHQLFTGVDSAASRSARAAGNSICSANMQKITKLARVAGELFVSLTPISTRGYSGPSANFSPYLFVAWANQLVVQSSGTFSPT